MFQKSIVAWPLRSDKEIQGDRVVEVLEHPEITEGLPDVIHADNGSGDA
jgi:hypothetical protein